MDIFNLTPLNNNEKFALFYGVMLGDGCISKYKIKSGKECFSIVVTGSLKDDYNFFNNILIPLLKSFGRKSVTIKKRKDCGAIELNFQDKTLFDKLKLHGFPVGKKGVKLNIPPYFYQQNLIKYVVAGFMATDGSLVLTKNPNKFYPRVEACSISKELIIQIYNFLSLNGMNGNYYLAKRKNPNPNSNIQYRLQFNGKINILLFKEKIDFLNPKYQKKFENFLSYSEKYDNLIKNVPNKYHRNIRLKTLNI